MESSLLFFIGGLAVFGISHLTQKHKPALRLIFFCLTALAFCLIMQAIFGSPFRAVMPLPPVLGAVMCVLAGLFLFLASQFRLFRMPGIQYFATLILAFLLTALVFLIIHFYLRSQGVMLPEGSRNSLLILILLQTFLFFFGFAFPQRMLGAQEARKRAAAINKKSDKDL
jgi:hypothetical protein